MTRRFVNLSEARDLKPIVIPSGARDLLLRLPTAGSSASPRNDKSAVILSEAKDCFWPSASPRNDMKLLPHFFSGSSFFTSLPAMNGLHGCALIGPLVFHTTLN